MKLLSLSVYARPPVLVVRPVGDLDVLSSGFLQLPCATRFEGVRRVMVDLEALEFCDLAGLRRLAHLYTDLSSAGTRVDLVAVPESLRRLARMARISHDSLPVGQ